MENPGRLRYQFYTRYRGVHVYPTPPIESGLVHLTARLATEMTIGISHDRTILRRSSVHLFPCR